MKDQEAKTACFYCGKPAEVVNIIFDTRFLQQVVCCDVCLVPRVWDNFNYSMREFEKFCRAKREENELVLKKNLKKEIGGKKNG